MATDRVEDSLKVTIVLSFLLMLARYLTQDPPPNTDVGSCLSDMLERLAPLETYSTDSLKGVVVFVRHGDRASSVVVEEDREFWTGLVRNDDFYPIPDEVRQREEATFPFGWLTTEGVCQMYRLGRSWLNERYGNFIHMFFRGSVQFFSTDYERTAMSARVIATALSFPEAVIKIRRREVDPLDPWESIPTFSKAVYEFEAKNETFLRLVKDKAAAAREVYDAMKGTYFKQESSFAWISAFDLFVSAEAHRNSSRPIDRLLDTPLKEMVRDATLAEFTCLYRDPRLRRLAVGGLLGGLANWAGAIWADDRFSQTIPAQADFTYFNIDMTTRFAVVACHDVNLLPLKIALGWEEPPTWPEYGSFLAFELYDNFVRILDSNARVRELSPSDFLDLCRSSIVNGG